MGDYFRSAMGIAVSIIPLVVVSSKPVITYLFSAMIIVFLAFGLRTILRHLTRIEVWDEGITVNLPFRKQIGWSDISALKIKYFSTRKNKKNGWLQMTVGGAGQSISVDSKISGFRDILKQRHRSRRRQRVSLDEASTANMEALDQVLREGTV